MCDADFDCDCECDLTPDVIAYDTLVGAGFDSLTAKKITLHYLLTRAAADFAELQIAAMECGYSLPNYQLTRES